MILKYIPGSRLKNICFTLFFFSLFPFIIKGQDLPKYGFSRELIDRANTAEDCDYLTEEEKNTVLLVNLARIAPQQFAGVMISMWYQNSGDRWMLLNNNPSDEYISSLVNDLNNCATLHPLYPTKKLYQLADIHARKMGELGKTGHSRKYGYSLKERIMGLQNENYFGENCSYGHQKSIDNVMQLLVDDGVKSLGHRKNILYKNYSSIGVAVRPHRKYTHNCVMDFK